MLITYDINTEALAEAIKLGVNLSPITQTWGIVMKQHTVITFRSGTSPDGVPWAPLVVRKGGKPLQDSDAGLRLSASPRYDATRTTQLARLARFIADQSGEQ